MAEEIDFEEQLEQEKRVQVEEEESEAASVGLTYKDSDGTVMEWDPVKRAFFPKIDTDFIARYQMNYGTNPGQANMECAPTYKNGSQAWYDFYRYQNQETSNEKPAKEGSDGQVVGNRQKSGQASNYSDSHYQVYSQYHGDELQKYLQHQGSEQMQSEEEDEDDDVPKADVSVKKKGKQKKGKDNGGVKRKTPEEPPAWFDVDAEKSTHVYVSGLTSDITEEEFKELMSKYGLIMFDPFTHKPKLKLYTGPDGRPKGDGLCCYIKQESVDLALKLLDGYKLRDSTISVERAKFQLKGDYDPTKKKKKLSNKMKRKLKEKQEKLFDWRPDKTPGVRFRFERIVILKHMFDLTEFEGDPTLINDLREDVRSECAKFGDVRKVQVYDHHQDGVIAITFRTPEEADACVSAMRGRWFAKRQIVAETYDGKTKYDVHETDAEKEERLHHWEAFLDDERSKPKTINVAESRPVSSDVGSSSTAIGAGADAVDNPSESGDSAATGGETNFAPGVPDQGLSFLDSSGAAADTDKSV